MSTIDPGMEGQIEEKAGDLDDHGDGANDEKDDIGETQDGEDDFMQPTQWWFASVACPLLAATFGPMASAFNICALVQHWRQTIPPGPHVSDEVGHLIEDPPWLLVCTHAHSEQSRDMLMLS